MNKGNQGKKKQEHRNRATGWSSGGGFQESKYSSPFQVQDDPGHHFSSQEHNAAGAIMGAI